MYQGIKSSIIRALGLGIENIHMQRCPWVTDAPDYIQYHDEHWGVCVYDARELFEKLCLDGQQAGLSWLTVLRKSACYRKSFANFDPNKLAKFTQDDIEACLQNKGLIRHRGKLTSIVTNARAFLAIEASGQDFSEFLWRFVDGKQKVNAWRDIKDVPTQTPESVAMSKALKKHGFRFVGPTICYAFMQAVGMVNDHLVDCWRYSACLEINRPE